MSGMEPDINEEDVVMYDATDDDAYAEGDIDLADVDPDDLEKLGALFDELMDHPEGDDRNLAVLGVLTKMHGDDLRIV